MWQDTDFKEKFVTYAPTPPESVWVSIAKKLDEDRDRNRGFWDFSNSQKFTLVAASLASMIFSAFIFKENCSRTETSISPKVDISYSQPEIKTEKQPIIEAVSAPKETKLKSKSIAQVSKLSSSPSVRKITTISIPNEYKEFKKEIKELAELDKQIEKLAEQVIKDNRATHSINHDRQIALNQILPSNAKKELEANLNTYLTNQLANNKLKADNEVLEKIDSANLLANLTKRPKFYITPYIGGNFTQVSYQGTPNSPYFSQNASFTGKIGYNLGFQLGYQFSKHWSIESGLAYGQYLQSFKENFSVSNIERKGIMYIDQIDLPLMIRYSIPFGGEKYPKTISFKGGLMYNSVVQYQVNYTDKNLSNFTEKSYQVEADKRLYNSLQLGYTAGLDFDAFLSKKISFNFSMLNSLVSQLENFPSFNQDSRRPLQFSTNFSIGTKIRF